VRFNFKRFVFSILSVAVVLQAFSGVLLARPQRVEAATPTKPAVELTATENSRFFIYDNAKSGLKCEGKEDPNNKGVYTNTCTWKPYQTDASNIVLYTLVPPEFKTDAWEGPDDLNDNDDRKTFLDLCNTIDEGHKLSAECYQGTATKATWPYDRPSLNTFFGADDTDNVPLSELKLTVSINPPKVDPFYIYAATDVAATGRAYKTNDWQVFRDIQTLYRSGKDKLTDKEKETAASYETIDCDAESGGVHSGKVAKDTCIQVKKEAETMGKVVLARYQVYKDCVEVHDTAGCQAAQRGLSEAEATYGASVKDPGVSSTETLTQSDKEEGICKEDEKLGGLSLFFGQGGVFTNITCWFLYRILGLKDILIGWLKPEVVKEVFIIKDVTAGGNGVLDIWNAIRTIINVLFIVAFLLIALLNVLRVDLKTWQFQRMIPQLIFAIILVNFSLAIFNFVILVSNTLVNYFFSIPKGLDELLATGDNTALSDISGSTVFGAFVKTITAIVFAGILLYMYILMWVRVIVINVFFGLAALPYVARILPFKQIQENVGKVWSMFVNWALMAPVAAMFLYIAGYAISTLGSALIPESATGGAIGGTATTGVGQSVLLQSAMAITLMYVAATQPLKLGGAIMSQAQGILSGKQGIPGTKFNPVKAIKEKTGEVGAGVKSKFAERTAKLANMKDEDIKGGFFTQSYLKAARFGSKGSLGAKRAAGAPGEFKKSAEKAAANAKKEYEKKRKKAGWENKLQQPFWEDDLNAEKDKIKSIDADYLMDQVENELLEEDAANPGQKKAKAPDKINKKKVAALMAKIQDVNNGVHGVDAQRRGREVMADLSKLTGDKFASNTKTDELAKMDGIIMGGDNTKSLLASQFLNRSRIGLYGDTAGAGSGADQLRNDMNRMTMTDIGGLPIFSVQGAGLSNISKIMEEFENEKIAQADQIINQLQSKLGGSMRAEVMEEIGKGVKNGNRDKVLRDLKSDTSITSKFSDSEIDNMVDGVFGHADFADSTRRYQNIEALNSRRTHYVEGNQARRFENYVNKSGFTEEQITNRMSNETNRINDLIKTGDVAGATKLAQEFYKPEFSGRNNVTQEELEKHLEATNRILDLRRKMAYAGNDNNLKREKQQAAAEWKRIKGPKPQGKAGA